MEGGMLMRNEDDNEEDICGTGDSDAEYNAGGM